MMIRLVCLRVRTGSGLSFFSWRRSKECNGQTERFDAISKDLKKRGMKFVGTIIIYAYLQSVEVGDHILHICQVDKFLGDEDKKGLYAWNGFGKVAPAVEG